MESNLLVFFAGFAVLVGLPDLPLVWLTVSGMRFNQSLVVLFGRRLAQSI